MSPILENRTTKTFATFAFLAEISVALIGPQDSEPKP